MSYNEASRAVLVTPLSGSKPYSQPVKEVTRMAQPEYTPDELAAEEWRPIPGLEAFYSVSDLGRIRSDRPYKNTLPHGILKCSGKYPKFTASINGMRIDCRAHIAAAHAFLGPCPAGNEVNHKDGNKQNPRVSNLEYLTTLENHKHASRTGLKATGSRQGTYTHPESRASGDRNGSRLHPERVARGERQGNAKLKDPEIEEIHSLLAQGLKQREVAALKSVSQTHIWRIAHKLSRVLPTNGPKASDSE
jgi:hypothetical protein